MKKREKKKEKALKKSSINNELITGKDDGSEVLAKKNEEAESKNCDTSVQREESKEEAGTKVSVDDI